MSLDPCGRTPQQIAAQASGKARHDRAVRRKEREDAINNAPPCGFCHGGTSCKSYPGVLVGDDRKPICRHCLKEMFPPMNGREATA